MPARASRSRTDTAVRLALNLEIDLFHLRDLVARALKEDVGTGDLTTDAVVPNAAPATLTITATESGVIAGTPVALLVFRQCDAELKVVTVVPEGTTVGPGEPVLAVHGDSRALLTAERTALNFLGQLSGIATLTRRYVEAIRGLEAVIVDTRKTTPGHRMLQKYATRIGGATNHRIGLYHFVLIKENHLAAAGCELGEAVRRCRKAYAGREVAIHAEAETIAELGAALDAGATCVLLDDFTLEALAEAVALRARFCPKTKLEASGGITLARVRDVAATGVDRISVGALTQDAPALDLSARLKRDPGPAS